MLASDLDAEPLHRIVSSDLHIVELDARAAGAVTKAIADFGPVEVLVNCVGWVHQGNIIETQIEDWQRSFQMNVDTAFYAIQASLPSMLAQGSGSIINISSVASSIKGFPARAAYGASKAALLGLTKSIAVDFAAKNIRCNAICPGTGDSPSLQARISSSPDPVSARSAFLARQPMGRFGSPSEIAALAAYMASDESAYMTGSVVTIDGAATA